MQALPRISLSAAWGVVKHHKRFFIVSQLVFIAIGLVIGFSIPRTYKAEIKLAPENSGPSLSGSLGSISSMLGMNLGNQLSEDAINPELYPDVKSSPDFLLGLCQIKVQTKDGQVKTDYKTYLTRHTKSTWWDALRLKLFPPKDSGVAVAPTGQSDKTIRLSMSDYMLLQGIDGAIGCGVDKKTGVITITAIDQDPLVAAILVDSVSARLQDFITDYRTSKARNDLQHFQKCYADADSAYEASARRYAAFADAHQDISLESYRVESDNLENEMQLAFNIRSQYATQVEMAKAKVLERTPVYTVLQKPYVPVKHDAPRRSFILLFWIFLGFVLSFLWKARKAERPVIIHNPQAERADAAPSASLTPEE